MHRVAPMRLYRITITCPVRHQPRERAEEVYVSYASSREEALEKVQSLFRPALPPNCIVEITLQSSDTFRLWTRSRSSDGTQGTKQIPFVYPTAKHTWQTRLVNSVGRLSDGLGVLATITIVAASACWFFIRKRWLPVEEDTDFESRLWKMEDEGPASIRRR
jgi:hypothetical protein